MAAASRRTVALQWRFPQPPAEVWRAWTEPALMSRWFGSDPDGTVRSARAEVRVGGSFEVTFVNADGTAYTCFGTYQEVEPTVTLTFTWAWRDRPGPEERIAVRLHPDGSGALMSFEHADIDPQTTHDYEAGWKRTFRKLQRVLQGKD